MRLPPFVVSSSCFASSRLCAANASRGESSGGISPATCRRGDGRPRREGEGKAVPKGPWDCDRRSMKFGLAAIFGRGDPSNQFYGLYRPLSILLSLDLSCVIICIVN
jgi:hypothetical protein